MNGCVCVHLSLKMVRLRFTAALLFVSLHFWPWVKVAKVTKMPKSSLGSDLHRVRTKMFLNDSSIAFWRFGFWYIPPGLTMNFWTIFGSFVWRLSSKICVSLMASSDRLCFLPVKNCVKLHPNLSSWGQKIIFPGSNSPSTATTHTPNPRHLRRLAPSLLKS